MSRSTKRLAAVPLLTLALGGCVTWQGVAGDPGAIITGERPSSARITMRDGSRVVVEEPEIIEEAVVGVVPCETLTASLSGVACGTGRVALARLGDVSGVELERVEMGKSLLAGFVAATVVTVVGSLVWAAQACSEGATLFCE